MADNKKTLGEKLKEIYKFEDLSTVCCRQCSCCRVACPQMKYSEALNIVDTIRKDWNKEDWADFLGVCVEYFFSKSLIKPCPLLDGVECRVYDERPLNCRLYGLWPEDMYTKRVEGVSKMLRLDKSEVPLNEQCQHVTRANNLPELTEEQINELFDALDSLDRDVGKFSTEQVRHYQNYRTVHDWALYFFFGEEWLVRMTQIAVSGTKENLSEFITVFKDQIRKMVLEEAEKDEQGIQSQDS